MVKDVLRDVLLMGVGIVLLVLGERFGWVIVILAGGGLVWRWRIGYMPPMDGVLLEDVKMSTKLRSSDPTTADRLTARALDDAVRRDEERRADLVRRAKTNRLAAVELRARLRYELKISPTIRQQARQFGPDTPRRVEFLREMDRRAAETQKQLAEVEELLDDYPFYIEWRDRATEYLRTPQSLPSGGPSASFAALAATAGILAIIALMRKYDVQLRMAISGVGALTAVLGAVRPRLFWELPSVEALREMFGDRTVVLISVVVGVLITIAAWRLDL